MNTPWIKDIYFAFMRKTSTCMHLGECGSKKLVLDNGYLSASSVNQSPLPVHFNWTICMRCRIYLLRTCGAYWVKSLSDRLESPVSWGRGGTEGAACSAHKAIFNSTLFSCHPAAMGYPTGWVTHWTEEMPTRRDGGKAQAAPSAAGNHSSLCVDVLYWVTSILVA